MALWAKDFCEGMIRDSGKAGGKKWLAGRHLVTVIRCLCAGAYDYAID
jgi:hypothetical protein